MLNLTTAYGSRTISKRFSSVVID